jgi:hypothetical protein
MRAQSSAVAVRAGQEKEKSKRERNTKQPVRCFFMAGPQVGVLIFNQPSISSFPVNGKDNSG